MKPWVVGILILALGSPLAFGIAVKLDELVPFQNRLPVPLTYSTEGSFIPGDPFSIPWNTRDFSLTTIDTSVQFLGSLTDPGTYLLEFPLPGLSLFLEVENPGVSGVVDIRGYSVQGFQGDLLDFRYEFNRGQEFVRGFEYRYNADERLRSLIETSPTGRVQTQEFRWEGDILREERLIRDDRTEVRILTPQGKTESLVVYRNGQKTEERRWTFYENGFIETRLVDTYNPPIRIESTYDGEQREVLRLEFRSGTLFSTQRFSYLGTSKEYLGLEVQQGTNLRRTVYEYSAEDTLVRTQTFLNRILVQESLYTGLARVDRFFQGGQEILRITYEDEVRVREEEIRGGRVIRSRTFPSTLRTVP